MSTAATPLAFLPLPRSAAMRRRRDRVGVPAAVLAALLVAAAALAAEPAAAAPLEGTQVLQTGLADDGQRLNSRGAALPEDGEDAAPSMRALATVSARLEARMARWARANLGQMPDVAGYGLLLAGLGVMDALTRKRRQHGG